MNQSDYHHAQHRHDADGRCLRPDAFNARVAEGIVAITAKYQSWCHDGAVVGSDPYLVQELLTANRESLIGEAPDEQPITAFLWPVD